MSSSTVILQAEFNPKIKAYILFVGVLLLTITIFGIPLIVIWLLGLGQLVSRKYYENLSCQLTSHHLEFKKGAFFKIEKTIPLENIQDLTFIQNPILNVLNLKILKVETAGNAQAHGSDMKLVGIIDAENFKKQVLLQREYLQTGQKSSFNSTNEQPDWKETNDLLREIRDLLKKKTTN
jgi:putative membrane protein